MARNTKFIHIRELANFYQLSQYGGMTVAFEVNKEQNAVFYASTRVHPRDRYVKQTGRVLATERLYSQDVRRIGVSELAAQMGNELNESAISKLTVDDFHWPVIVEAVKRAVVLDEADRVMGNAAD